MFGVCKMYVDSCVIDMCISCPHASKQNKVAILKMWHVFKLGFDVFAQQISKCCWFEAFYIVAYIINGSLPHQNLFLISFDFCDKISQYSILNFLPFFFF